VVVHNTEGGNGFNPKADSEDDHSLNIDFQSLTSGALNNSSNNNDNDGEHSKEEEDINRPQHP